MVYHKPLSFVKKALYQYTSINPMDHYNNIKDTRSSRRYHTWGCMCQLCCGIIHALFVRDSDNTQWPLLVHTLHSCKKQRVCGADPSIVNYCFSFPNQLVDTRFERIKREEGKHISKQDCKKQRVCGARFEKLF